MSCIKYPKQRFQKFKIMFRMVHIQEPVSISIAIAICVLLVARHGMTSKAWSVRLDREERRHRRQMLTGKSGDVPPSRLRTNRNGDAKQTRLRRTTSTTSRWCRMNFKHGSKKQALEVTRLRTVMHVKREFSGFID